MAQFFLARFVIFFLVDEPIVPFSPAQGGCYARVERLII